MEKELRIYGCFVHSLKPMVHKEQTSKTMAVGYTWQPCWWIWRSWTRCAEMWSFQCTLSVGCRPPCYCLCQEQCVQGRDWPTQEPSVLEWADCTLEWPKMPKSPRTGDVDSAGCWTAKRRSVPELGYRRWCFDVQLSFLLTHRQSYSWTIPWVYIHSGGKPNQQTKKTQPRIFRCCCYYYHY